MGCEIQRMKSGVLSRVLWTNLLNFQPHYTNFSKNDLCSIFFFFLFLHNSSIEETKYAPCRHFNLIQNVTPCLPIIWSNQYSQLTITTQLPRCSGTWCAAQNHFLPPAPPGCSSPACRRGGDTQVQQRNPPSLLPLRSFTWYPKSQVQVLRGGSGGPPKRREARPRQGDQRQEGLPQQEEKQEDNWYLVLL